MPEGGRQIEIRDRPLPGRLAAAEGGRPRVFFDCDGRDCNSQYYRTEIGWVDWVNDPAVADEQINVGFSFGDNYPRPYFYLTVYPGVVEFPDNSLPEFAEWNTDGWSGVRVPYDGLAGMKKPEKLILDLFTALIEDASLQLKEAR